MRARVLLRLFGPLFWAETLSWRVSSEKEKSSLGVVTEGEARSDTSLRLVTDSTVWCLFSPLKVPLSSSLSSV